MCVCVYVRVCASRSHCVCACVYGSVPGVCDLKSMNLVLVCVIGMSLLDVLRNASLRCTACMRVCVFVLCCAFSCATSVCVCFLRASPEWKNVFRTALSSSHDVDAEDDDELEDDDDDDDDVDDVGVCCM